MKLVVSLLVIATLASVTGAYALGSRGNAGTTVEGPAGPQGQTGLQGTMGLTGPAGKDGINGENGFNGIRGNAGLNGSQGSQGAQGPTGLTGPAGPVGPQGPAGTVGTDPNVMTYHEFGSAGADVTLGTFGPFTLLGRCVTAGTDKYESSIVLRSTQDNALVTDAGGRGHVFSSADTESRQAYAVNYSLFYPVPPWPYSMSTSTSFWAISADNSVVISGEQATAVKEGLTNPTCVWIGTVRTVSN